MKLAVSYDAEGKIITMFDSEKLRSEKVTLQYVPASGERHEVIELPKEFEKENFLELPRLLRVNATGGSVKFERR
jgi:hypothetical protein